MKDLLGNSLVVIPAPVIVNNAFSISRVADSPCYHSKLRLNLKDSKQKPLCLVKTLTLKVNSKTINADCL